MEFKLLGPLEASDGSAPVASGGTQAARTARAAAAGREPDGRDRSAGGRPLGRGRSRVGAEDGADLRLAAAQGPAEGHAAHPPAGVRDRDRPGERSTSSASSVCGARARRRMPRGTPTLAARAVPRGARALARRSARRVPGAVRAGRRRPGSTSSTSPASRRGSTQTSIVGVTPSWSPSSRRWSRGIRCERASARGSCSRSTAQGASPRRSRATRRFRAQLADELGLEPSAALKELERRILRQDSDLDLEAPAAAPVTAPRTTCSTSRAATSRSPTRWSATGRSTSCSCTGGCAAFSRAGSARRSRASTTASRRSGG